MKHQYKISLGLAWEQFIAAVHSQVEVLS